MGAEPQEVAPICLLIVVTIGDNTHTAYRQHGLWKETNMAGEALGLSRYRSRFMSKFLFCLSG